MGKLYIIGNGFDIAQGLKTQYSDFHEYLKLYYPELEREVAEIFYALDSFSEIDLWSELEGTLEKMDNYFYANLVEDMGVNEDSPFYDETLATLERKSECINILKKCFVEWIENVNIVGESLRDDITNNNLYVTFNYTETLEQLYGIRTNLIFHIHGKVGEKIILGTNNKFSEDWNHLKRDRKGDTTGILDPYNEDWKVEEQREKIKALTDLYYKPVKEIIYNLKKWLSVKMNPSEIIVIGHSYGSVDWDYFSCLKKLFSDKSWTYFAFNEETEKNLVEMLSQFQRDK